MSKGTVRVQPPLETATDRLEVAVIEGPDRGSRHPIEAPVLVGTSSACELELTDPTISRRHLQLEPGELGVRLRDEGSRNGTWQGEVRLYDADLAVGSEFRIGTTRLRVEAGSPASDSDKASPREQLEQFGDFLGSSAVLAPMYAKLRRVVTADTTVLLEGESGTGKELLAEAIHEKSARADKPFLVVDCGALPENLIEAELFGYERGAFTGADRATAGAFEMAAGGTVFLDEIGELPATLQTRLLRVLDRGQIRRLGSQKRMEVNVRIIAATNRNLDREVEETRFRLDLFHRLAVALIRVPALRDRTQDIPMLAKHFVGTFGGGEELLTEDVQRRLASHPWPGNVRELRNYIERMVLFDEPQPLRQQPAGGWLERVRESADSEMPYRQARAQALQAFTGAYVERMLAAHQGNVSKAAHAAGVARRHFQRLKQDVDE